ncbi:structural maintenance of chromosomes protein 5 [Aristolochia californica]|uniref:structural maintenance of chromosomes protein 5 n=1 Tax=Aristolochia californica TaxID=171875 RepID=UPI0035D5E8A9
MARRAAKLPKFEHRGEDDFLPGTIFEIELHNFMVFDRFICNPGPGLNLITGPNGCGKSSVVCAIALGLAGEPQVLGRATNVGAYVKRGEDSGSIRITLIGDSVGQVTSIMRKIDVLNKSDWFVNGKQVAKRDVIDVTKRFNIQVNNLTQFLPQDRVCEFAKLSPVQLLEETEKAVGNPELPVQHCSLVEKSCELKKLQTTVKQNGDTLNQLKALNAELEKDVERVRQRELLLEKDDLMRKKLPWLKYDMKKKEYMQAKELEDNAKKQLDEAAKILNDLRGPIEQRKQVKEMHEGSLKKISSFINQNGKKRMEILDKENRLGVHVHGKCEEMDELRRQEESRQQRISKAKDDLANAERELADLPPYEPPKEELEKLLTRILELEDSAQHKRLQKAEKENALAQRKGSLKQCLNRLNDMENANIKLLHALRNSGVDKIFDAYEWVQRNRSDLQKEVFGPVLLEVNVSNRVHAAYLEDQVPYYIWKSFITQDSTDRDFLVKGLRSYDVPVLNYVEDRFPTKETFYISDEMRRLGIYSRLDQIFEAPNAVKEVLISQAGLERSYIGSAETDQKADEVPRLGISDLWTPENHYRWSTSRYGGHVSAMVKSVAPSRLFMSSVDVGEIEKFRSRKKELEADIFDMEQTLRALQSEQRHLEDEAAKLRKQREEIVAAGQLEKRKRREMENQIYQRKRKLESIEKEDDLDTNTNKIIDQVAKLNEQRFQLGIEIKNSLIETVSFKWSFAEKHIASIEMGNKIRDMEANLKQQEKAALQASLQFENCKKESGKRRQELAALKSEAESIAKITPELEQAFLQMPTTIEELEAAIQDNISQANSILLLNHNILEEYGNRQRKITSMTKKLEADEIELNRCLADVENLKENWLQTLRNLVSCINETFGRIFKEMAVAGEVSLDEHGVDFDKYGILIKVKFRQTGQLQVLSAHHQSGGERSVSTILYLVSLQDLTNCPFRVVDEINQGMDPINERKMFQQLARAACQPKTPQCFLLTPKLLPKLPYGHRCTVLHIFHGPHIAEYAKEYGTGKSWSEVVGLACHQAAPAHKA